MHVFEMCFPYNGFLFFCLIFFFCDANSLLDQKKRNLLTYLRTWHLRKKKNALTILIFWKHWHSRPLIYPRCQWIHRRVCLLYIDRDSPLSRNRPTSRMPHGWFTFYSSSYKATPPKSPRTPSPKYNDITPARPNIGTFWTRTWFRLVNKVNLEVNAKQGDSEFLRK